MQWQTEYFDLCDEIELLEIRAKDLQYQLEMAHDTCYTGRMPGGGLYRLPLDKALVAYDIAKERLLALMEIIEHKKDTKKKMEHHAAQFQGLANQVAYRRDIAKQSLSTIAQELGYSYHWIARVSSNTPRYQCKKSTKSA